MSANPPAGEQPGAARIEGRAPALRPSVPLYRHMLYGAGLPNALDFLTLAHIHFMCEDGRSFSVDDLVEALRSEGILAANGKGLIGSKAVYQSVARLRDAGFLHRAQGNGGSFGKVSYTFYEFPSLNPYWTPAAGSDRGWSEPVGLSGEAAPTLPMGNHISAGHTASPDKARADSARPDRRSGSADVSAGQPASPDRRSGNAAPPTPPRREEEDSSSRKSSSTTAVPADAQPTDAAAVTAAAEFLAELPGRWACGRKTAGELAPLLTEAAQAQGWELGTDLVQQLTRRSQARRGAPSVLRERIEDLPRYRAARRALEQERERSTAGRVPGQQQLVLDGNQHGRGDTVPRQDVALDLIEQARVFLLTLNGPWALGPEVAERLAPLLADRASERGWVFDERLRQQLMSNPGGGQNYEWLLEHRRIATLPDLTRRPERRREVPAGMCGRHPGFREGDCSPCMAEARRTARQAAERDRDQEQQATPSAGLQQPAGAPADVMDQLRALAAGAANEEDARRDRQQVSDRDRDLAAERQRHEAHRAAWTADGS
ncbi:hypothetical protein [Streptomyces sp. t39]|uniref:hypothetical protein n=1 Tax=Streptomyces sp. t39 TaxID=1828156 RepID=UPI0011CE7096|nr:hypothetical protein [Streptomyces sp. t39]TXS34838.1 hypothetical protein EAO77_38380 [Streptomyces sp. t39]